MMRMMMMMENHRIPGCPGVPDHCSRPEPQRGAAFATGTVAKVGPVDGLLFPMEELGSPTQAVVSSTKVAVQSTKHQIQTSRQ